ncbi:hypothetical protein Bbelb_163260 [Branchiostoma belcheri]|nr:hypothetical protein Bbelb_163260 [Branchiostoma belcheri]
MIEQRSDTGNGVNLKVVESGRQLAGIKESQLSPSVTVCFLPARPTVTSRLRLLYSYPPVSGTYKRTGAGLKFLREGVVFCPPPLRLRSGPPQALLYVDISR